MCLRAWKPARLIRRLPRSPVSCIDGWVLNTLGTGPDGDASVTATTSGQIVYVLHAAL